MNNLMDSRHFKSIPEFLSGKKKEFKTSQVGILDCNYIKPYIFARKIIQNALKVILSQVPACDQSSRKDLLHFPAL